MRLCDRDYVDAAQELECELAVVKAVAQVESRGTGFLPNGEPKILFEAHHFSRLTGHVYDKLYPKISSREWNRDLYTGGVDEHRRLRLAAELNRDAALQSASWGAFQIMGFNWRGCNCRSLQEFVNAMYAGESEQLHLFIAYIKSQGLAKLLQKKQWAAFAEKYNGRGFRNNKYDIRLEQAYKSFLS
jgi:hypothetical protein